ncbi:merozoite surface protein CMZ-8-like [Sphaeramia orbicularis]|uniref:merozoite surface protein CMZ-8-like n=1 Tax=Sphaeramia orbicularis TaxID=375764 RepID=UPI00118011C8|nr:merozoite surface protein CMZ-8-like [Sphaeramia orbicularis]
MEALRKPEVRGHPPPAAAVATPAVPIQPSANASDTAAANARSPPAPCLTRADVTQLPSTPPPPPSRKALPPSPSHPPPPPPPPEQAAMPTCQAGNTRRVKRERGGGYIDGTVRSLSPQRSLFLLPALIQGLSPLCTCLSLASSYPYVASSFAPPWILSARQPIAVHEVAFAFQEPEIGGERERERRAGGWGGRKEGRKEGGREGMVRRRKGDCNFTAVSEEPAEALSFH